jgi:hypothetical protein
LKIINKRVKVVLVYATKTYRKNRVTAPLILHLDSRWRRMVNFKARPLYPRVITKVPISVDGGGGPQSLFELFAGEKNILPLPGFKPQNIPTLAHSLYQLSYYGSLN